MSTNGNYPKAIQLKNIKPPRRVCYNCSTEIRGHGYFYVIALRPGNYLCASCERRRAAQEVQKA